ncbi:menaquinone biosynthesis decarboxylase [Millionella massiliensis]|uniref:menaquinone biosynthesis decarboxylase n=1 Tax=Millionella massiliensis TaxID=1871023 RepID=UPI0008D8DB2C|nr:menaquinone biosynthesis decarboxylase [Millionella massiliensis]
MYRNLAEYVAALERAGQLIRISAPVDPELEIAELTDRQAKLPGGGRALLFENTGTGFPVLTNMMGSERRICMALGVERLAEVGERIDALFAEAVRPKKSWVEKLRMLPLLKEVAAWLPREVSRRGECQQVVMQGDGVDLGRLPVLRCWPHDGGRFVTLPLVHTVDPETGVRNVGMYRMQIFDGRTTGMHWHRHKTGERHYEQYRQCGERMPVTVCLGGDPVYTYSATAPLPDGLDEYLLAGFLRRRPMELVKCLTNDLRVPADCDFVIEGYVDPAEPKVIEGDFGDHTGFYSLKDLYPRFHVTCITHRRGAIWPATLVGVPPMEDAYIQLATERIFLAPIRLAVAPEVVDLWMPPAGVAHNIAVCVIRKSYPGQALKVANALWGAGQMSFNKFLIVLSAEDAEGCTGNDYLKVIRERLHCFDPAQDALFSRGVLDVLDHSAPQTGFGGKLCLDLTRKLPEEGGERLRRERIPVEIVWDEFVQGTELTFDERVWLAAGNTDPARDVTVTPEGVLRLDARFKPSAVERGWPNVVTMSAEVIDAVDRRWAEYGIGEPLIPSPSRRYLPLVRSDAAKL